MFNLVLLYVIYLCRSSKFCFFICLQSCPRRLFKPFKHQEVMLLSVIFSYINFCNVYYIIENVNSCNVSTRIESSKMYSHTYFGYTGEKARLCLSDKVC